MEDQKEEYKVILKEQDYDKLLSKINQLREGIDKNLEISKLNNERTWKELFRDGFFGFFFDRPVTAPELNKVLTQIQNKFIENNTRYKDTVEQFFDLYEVMAQLDKNYINAINASIKGLEETSKKHKTLQNELKDTVEEQAKIIEQLTNFKKNVKIIIEEHKIYIEKNNEKINTSIELQNRVLKMIDNFMKKQNDSIEKINTNLKDQIEKNNNVIKEYDNKIKYSYIISFVLFIIILIQFLMGFIK